MGTLYQLKQYVQDSLTNLINGIGTAKDPRSGWGYTFTLLNQVELEAAYRGDWLARRIVDAPAEDATREWRDWQAEKDQITLLEEAERKLDMRRTLRKALAKARLYGGSAIVMGIAGQGNSETEMNIEKVGKDDLRFIAVFSQFDLNASERIIDVDSEWFGRPKYYTLSSRLENFNGKGDGIQQIKIHPSRVIPLVGNELPDDVLLSASNMWGDSVLQVVDEALKASGSVIGSIASLISDAKMDVIKTPNLTAMLSDEEASAKLITRYTRANQLKSNISTLLLDEKEEWERIQTQFAAFPSLIDSYIRVACGAAGIPLTRIFGESKGGLGNGESGGQSDIRNYYDDISSMQENELSPTLTPLDQVFLRSVLGTFDEKIYYEWSPLWQMSDTEKATIAKQKADTTKVYVDSGIINTDALREAVVNQLLEDMVYPGLEDAIDEFGSEPDEPVVGPEQIDQHMQMLQKSSNQLTKIGTHAVNNNAALAKRLAPKPKPKMAAKTKKMGDAWYRQIGDAEYELMDAEPRSLYVRRDVLNANTIIRWAKAQGFVTTLPADEMHVTVIYSKTPVDWMKMGTGWSMDSDNKLVVPAGGPRMLDMFGPEKDVVVLLFVNDDLKWRHERMVSEGASFDYPEYQPHITITMNKPAGLDINKVEPYRGPIILGPEIFEEIKPGAMENVVEDSK